MATRAEREWGGWRGGIVLLFACFLVGMGTTALFAVRRGSPVVDADYYNHGLHYGETRGGGKNPGLEWTLHASVAGGELRVSVQDGGGAPVGGGRLSFLAREPGGECRTLALAESSPGVFRGALPAAQGELRGTLDFSRQDGFASGRLLVLGWGK